MAFKQKKIRLGDVLVDQGLITEDQLVEVLEKQQETHQRLGEILIEMGLANEEKIANALSQQCSIEYVVLSEKNIPEQIRKLIPDVNQLKKFQAFPFELDDYDTRFLKVAMVDPLDLKAIDDLSIVTGMQITPCIATATDISRTIDRYYGDVENQKVAEEFAREREEEEEIADDQVDEKNAAVENSPLVRLVSRIIEQGAREKASDIHIEPFETFIRVRYRVDGVMHVKGTYKISLLAAINTRLKIIGGMDISEKRKPQDGRITQVVDKVEYDIRVSMLPTVYGEKTVMRLTEKKALSRDKRMLGFDESELSTFDKIFGNPNGIILVTGPTGSGKSTTLYTALSELNKEDVNIITVEDPVEANITGINQVQVNNKAGLTFAAALRSILRQDPDIIMIGEIRDQETASIAVTASITGHLVVSTLHTNSAAASITRLADMGLEYYLIADSVVGVIAQRLVRRLCPDCKVKRMATQREKMIMGADESEEIEIYDKGGYINGDHNRLCPKCAGKGFKGRIGVYEMLPISNKIKSVIAAKGTSEAIQKAGLEEGMSTLQISCSRLVRKGITTMSELTRIVYAGEEVQDDDVK